MNVPTRFLQMRNERQIRRDVSGCAAAGQYDSLQKELLLACIHYASSLAPVGENVKQKVGTAFVETPYVLTGGLAKSTIFLINP